MESTKKSSTLLIAFLLAVVVGLTALDMYQDKVIERQRSEIRWLLTHAVIQPDAPAPAKGAPPAPAPAQKSDEKAKATVVPAATEAAAAVAPGAPTAKP